MGNNIPMYVAALAAALVALLERFGASPVVAVQPMSASTHAAKARKADDRVLPRGRRH